jgi:TonB-linked SusC/RagA family outer membrane protein
VLIKGTTAGTITNSDGSFRIQVPENANTLVFSFIGMKTTEVDITNQSTVLVAMEEETIGLEEVVAIGYGYIKKSDLTGTVSSVEVEKTKDLPNTNVLQSLQGQVAGLTVGTPNRPGGSPSFRIRGINSLSASNTPLIVVDGIIYNGSLNDFNVNDIEKIDILKDASAAAVYGSRSANGVLIITTKMGVTNKPVFNFNSYVGISNPTDLIPVKDGPGYLQKILDFRTALGYEADPAKIETYINLTELENYRNGKSIDWYDYIVKSGISQNYNLNVSGRSENTQYFLSGTYLSQEGIVENDNFKRFTFRGNFINNITDWYTVSLRTGSYSELDYSGNQAGLYWGLSPYGSYWEDEAAGVYKEYPMEDPYFSHPMINTYVDNKDKQSSLFGLFSSELNFPFLNGLKWTFNYSTNKRINRTYNFWNNTLAIGGGKTSNGVAVKNIGEAYDWTLDNILNYRKVFREVHNCRYYLLIQQGIP